MNPRRYEHERYEEQRSEAARRYRSSEDPSAQERGRGSYPRPHYEDPRDHPEYRDQRHSDDRGWESGEDVGGHRSWSSGQYGGHSGGQYDDASRGERERPSWEPAGAPYGPPPAHGDDVRSQYRGARPDDYPREANRHRDPTREQRPRSRGRPIGGHSSVPLGGWAGGYGGTGGGFGPATGGYGTGVGWGASGSGYETSGGDYTADTHPGRRETSHRGKGPRGYSRSDARIKEDICERLMEDDAIDASDIEIDVANGEVTISGNVDRRDIKRQVEDVVEDVMGVKHVQNNIRVEKDRASDDQKDWKGAGARTAPSPLQGSGNSGTGFPSSGTSAKQRADTKSNL